MSYKIVIDNKIHEFEHAESFFRVCMLVAAGGLDKIPTGAVKWIDRMFGEEYSGQPTFWSPYAFTNSGMVLKPWAISGYRYLTRLNRGATKLDLLTPEDWDEGYSVAAALVGPAAADRRFMGDLPEYLKMFHEYTHGDEGVVLAMKHRIRASIASASLVIDPKAAKARIEQGVIVG